LLPWNALCWPNQLLPASLEVVLWLASIAAGIWVLLGGVVVVQNMGLVLT
jgi:hypothetical protein